MDLYVNRYGNVVVNHNSCEWTLSPECSINLFNDLAKYNQPKPTISAELDYLKEFVVNIIKPEVFFDGSINYMVRPIASSDNYLEDFRLSKEATKYIESVVRDNLIKKIEANVQAND
jgi:hypothetical protein